MPRSGQRESTGEWVITRLDPTDGVDLWLVALDVPTDNAVLETAEREPADACLDERHAARIRASRTGLWSILEVYTGVPASCLAFTVSRSGAPVLAGHPDVRFSVSRSGGLAVVAVAAGRRVGIDIEHAFRSAPSCDALAGHCLDTKERAAHLAQDERAQCQAVLGAWTRREAALKAMDRGLMDHRSPTPDETGPATLVAAGWQLSRPDLGSDHVVALVTEARAEHT